jgi:hypothetical protein
MVFHECAGNENAQVSLCCAYGLLLPAKREQNGNAIAKAVSIHGLAMPWTLDFAQTGPALPYID